jgi:hypothetical protein
VAKLPELDVNNLLSLEIKLKGVRRFTLKLRVAQALLTITSWLLGGSGVTVEMETSRENGQ